MSVIPVPGPTVPTGVVIHPALEMFADADDPDEYADLHLIVGLTVTFTPEIKGGVVWHAPSGDVSLRPLKVTGKYNAAGQLCLLKRDGAVSPNEGVRLAVTDHPLMEPSGWKWRAEWENNAFPSGTFSLASGQVFNLSAVVLGGALPVARPTLVDQLLVAYTDLRQLILDNPGGGGGPADWDTLQNRPAVVAAGSSKAIARAAIDAIAATDVAEKADAAVVNAALALKANATSLSAKADTATVDAALALKANASSLATKANALSGAPGTFWGVRTAAEWAALGAPTGTGPWWGVST